MKTVFSDIDHTLMYDLTVADETIRLVEQVRERALDSHPPIMQWRAGVPQGAESGILMGTHG